VWEADIRTGFLRELRDCFGNAGTAVRNSWIKTRATAQAEPLSGRGTGREATAKCTTIFLARLRISRHGCLDRPCVMGVFYCIVDVF